MANLIAEQQQSSFPDFADRKQLAENETKFCIDAVKLHMQKDNKERWYLTIHYLESDGEIVYRTLTFDRSESRDKTFTTMEQAADWPQHNCWVEKRVFKNKSTSMSQTFYQLRQVNGYEPCTCTMDAASPSEEETPDPFLPDDLMDGLN